MATHNLWGWSDQLWLTIDQTGILIGIAFPLSSLLLSLILWFYRQRIKRWWRRNSFPKAYSDPTGLPPATDGLVFTVSHAELPLWMMHTLRPRWVGFVTSRESHDCAEHTLLPQASELGIEALEVITIDDCNDLAAIRTAVAELLQALHKEGCQQRAVDLTGGTVPMSLGAFMAAEENGARSLYVSCGFDRKLNKPDTRSARILTISAPRN